jgi:hypothetical protein
VRGAKRACNLAKLEVVKMEDKKAVRKAAKRVDKREDTKGRL